MYSISAHATPQSHVAGLREAERKNVSSSEYLFYNNTLHHNKKDSSRESETKFCHKDIKPTHFENLSKPLDHCTPLTF